MSAILIAWKNLIGEKGRFLITIGGVAFAVTLILVLVGLYQGWSRQMTKFLGNIETDFWLGQRGSRDMSHTVSILPAVLEDKLQDVAGVEKVTPFIGRQVSFEINGQEAHLYLIAMDDDRVIRPYQVVSGKSVADPGEIIVDQTFFQAKDLTLGDRLNIAGQKLKVVGISLGGNLMVYTYALANEVDVRQILEFREFNNYYLVKSRDPAKTETSLKEQFPDLAVMSKDQFLANNRSLLEETFLPIIAVLVIIALAIGIAVIGLTIFTATIEKAREYGVLKAIGYPNFSLFTIALFQSIVSGLIGFLVGNLLVRLVVALATKSTSSFIYEVSSQEKLAVFGLTILMSIIAAFIPLYRITKIDPAEVFKA